MEPTYYVWRIVSHTRPNHFVGLPKGTVAPAKTRTQFDQMVAEELGFYLFDLIEARGDNAAGEIYVLQVSPFGTNWLSIKNIVPFSEPKYGKCEGCDDDLEEVDAAQGDSLCGICRDNLYVMVGVGRQES